ncbi:MAG: ChrR family anti-sigma-E factor [Alphaproteobacteria bacterium]|nr:ChrR family anti-sigma-E factor [Alphaproteobacteria bacterium]
MTIGHHPTTATLVELANGSLDLGRSIVVAAHIEVCPACQADLHTMETVGGCLLETIKPVPVDPGAVSRALARIAYEGGRPVESAQATVPAPTAVRFLPRAVRSYAIGDWQWIGPGIHRRDFEIPGNSGARVFLLKAQPGTRMPDHTHTGTELTLVLTGAYVHEHGRFHPGDIEEADGSVDHQPVVEDGETCICLVALEGTLSLNGLSGRLLQPFVRI